MPARESVMMSPIKWLRFLRLCRSQSAGQQPCVADGDRVTLCGYSGEDNAEMQALYAEAFGG